MHVLPGFNVELLYSVPRDQQGSWVSMCHDDKGRLIVSDQDGGLYRITPPALGNDPTRVESIDLDIGHAQGLVYAWGHLYAVTNSKVVWTRALSVKDNDGDDLWTKSPCSKVP